MISFFRRIRQTLLSENKFSKYFKYAIGEILLVVIGILIALQINNWNQDRQKTTKLIFYYEKLVEEVDQQILITKNYITRFDSLSKMQTRTLKILATKNEEDIPELTQNIGSVAMIATRRYSLETFEEFLKQGLITQVKNEELKQLLEDLELHFIKIKGGDDYANNQYNTLIEPYFARHINYANNAFFRYKDRLISGGPQTDFKSLFNSMELWNVATFKLETTSAQHFGLNKVLETLKALKKSLEKELNND